MPAAVRTIPVLLLFALQAFVILSFMTYACDICDRPFPTRSGTITHKKNSHARRPAAVPKIHVRKHPVLTGELNNLASWHDNVLTLYLQLSPVLTMGRPSLVVLRHREETWKKTGLPLRARLRTSGHT
jgi:hypothetical protein